MTGPRIQPPSGTTPPGWTPPDDDWDRPVLRLRTAWLAGIGMVAGGSAIAVFGLASLLGSIGTDGSGWLAFGLVALAGGVAAIVGLAFLLGAAQATIRLRRRRS